MQRTCGKHLRGVTRCRVGERRQRAKQYLKFDRRTQPSEALPQAIHRPGYPLPRRIGRDPQRCPQGVQRFPLIKSTGNHFAIGGVESRNRLVKCAVEFEGWVWLRRVGLIIGFWAHGRRNSLALASARGLANCMHRGECRSTVKPGRQTCAIPNRACSLSQQQEDRLRHIVRQVRVANGSMGQRMHPSGMLRYQCRERIVRILRHVSGQQLGIGHDNLPLNSLL